MKKNLLKLLALLVLPIFSAACSKNINADTTPEMDFLENSWRFTDGVRLSDSETDPMTDGGYGFMNIAPKEPVMKGIDVSKYDGKIDWGEVKNEVDYAIIRCGYGQNYTKQDDPEWLDNVNGCIENEIPFGVYIYSYATTVSAAKSEAEHVLRLVDGQRLRFPVYYDMEDEKTQGKLSNKQLADIAKAFCDTIADAGYDVGIYANTTWWNTKLTEPFFDSPDLSKWVAQYNSVCTYMGNYDMWQYTCTGNINGITGSVDMNNWYKDVRKFNTNPQ